MTTDDPPSPTPAANPYTRWLRSLSGRPKTDAPVGPAAADADATADAFIADWDRLERLVIDVYRRGESDGQDEAEWQWLRQALGEHHAAEALAPHWSGVLAGGEVLAADPFETLTALPRAADLIDNRRAMQLLPAAREALNRWLLTLADRPA